MLEARGLSVIYGTRKVLDIPSFQVLPNKVTTIIGPNGSGKTTLLLCLSLLIKPTTGQVLYKGQAISGNASRMKARRNFAVVFQESLLLNTTVWENVTLGLKLRGVPHKDIRDHAQRWLERFGIAHLAPRHARTLSGGEAQRASLARAFVLKPEVLFLDEPFAALDAPTRSRLLQDLHALLSQTSITTVFITHDLDEALLLGDRVAVLLGGVLRQVGRPQDVFTAPSDGEVAAFVGVETVIAGKVAVSRNGQVTVSANGLSLEAVGDLEVGKPVLFCLRPEDITLSLTGEVSPTSARNHLTGRISRMTPSGPLVRVVVDCGLPVVALITRGSANEMKLVEGTPVIAGFKATAVHLIPR